MLFVFVNDRTDNVCFYNALRRATFRWSLDKGKHLLCLLTVAQMVTVTLTMTRSRVHISRIAHSDKWYRPNVQLS